MGAHPDDCEIKAGGTCVKWVEAGFRVVLVSMTNGDIGHHEMKGHALALRRKEEAQRSAEIAGVESRVLDYHDGELMPTLEARRELVEIIREYEADVVITHRPNDYHPDHRYTSQIVQDSAYMVTVPHFAASARSLRKNPVYLYFMDAFEKPIPFKASVAVSVDDVMKTKWQMLDAMESQIYEWLAWHDGVRDDVPEDADARMKWMQRHWGAYFRKWTKGSERVMSRWLGPGWAKSTRYVELFELSEYGHRPSKKELAQLFPFRRKRVKKGANR